MILDKFKIQDWKVNLIIVKDDYDPEIILEKLWDLGCTFSLALETYENIISEKDNIGFTYVNYSKKESLILIGIHTSNLELINTIVHESRHLQLYIANSRGLDLNSEEVCYLIGKIAQNIYSKCIDNNII